MEADAGNKDGKHSPGDAENRLTAGPHVRSPDGLIDLTDKLHAYGMRGGLYADQNVWSDFAKTHGDAMTLVHSMAEGIDKALVSDRADRMAIDFKHWYRKSARSTKAVWARLRATIYYTEDYEPWIHLTESPKRAHRWRGHSLD